VDITVTKRVFNTSKIKVGNVAKLIYQDEFDYNEFYALITKVDLDVISFNFVNEKGEVDVDEIYIDEVANHENDNGWCIQILE